MSELTLPSRPSMARSRPTFGSVVFSLAVLGLLVLSVPAASQASSAAVTEVAEAALATPASLLSSSLPAAQLSAATDSLESGAGPAHGHTFSCGGVGGADSSVSCSASASGARVHPSSDAPLTGFSPASWQEVGAPTPSYGMTLVYDGADHYVLGFGTGISDNATAETWAYQDGVWTDVTPAYSPPARVSSYLAYDPVDGYVVMFGGWASSAGGPSEYGDTWTYAGGVWTELHPKYSPSPRDSGVMTWDGKDGYIVLFGSYSGDNDTWSFVGGDWTEQIASSECTGPGGPTPCPLGVEDASMAYDPVDGYVVMFGGDYYSGGNNYVQDTWAYSGGHWTNLTASPCTSSTCPAGRENAMMTWDAADGYVLLYGGYDKKDLEDTWKFLGGAWTEIISSCSGGICPPKTDSAGMAYDAADGYVVMFGGYAQEDSSWKYEAGVWYPLTQNTTPEARYNMALTYDTASDEVVMFGGSDGHELGSTWTFSDGQWTNVTANPCSATTCPDARWGANMTYDAKDGYVVLFGGEDTAGDLRDTWTFSDGTWTELTTVCAPTTCPSARSGFALAYDDAAKEVVLFGGDAAGTLEQDTWTYSAGTWAEVDITCTSTTCPSARTGAAMTFDVADDYLLLWGGQTGASTYVNDTWDFASGAWTEISSGACTYAAPCPDTGAAADLVYDPALGVTVLFGGGYGSGVSSSVWYYLAGAWTDAYPTVAPTARTTAGMVYDEALGGLVLFGGWNREALGDTWMLAPPVFAQEPYATPATIDLGQSVVFSAGAIGGGTGSTYSYLWQGLPPGCTVTVATPTVSCTPTLNGTYYVSTVVEDNNNGAGAATSYILMFTVDPDPTVVLSSTASRVDLGQWANFTASMSGGTGTPVFDWTGLPPTCGAVSTGTLDCQLLTSADLGTWAITVSAVDGVDATSPAVSLSLTVLADPTLTPPVASASSIDLGQTLTLSTHASGGGSGYTYVWYGLPPGCGGSAAQISCSPTGVGAGTFTPSVEALDALGVPTANVSATSSFSVFADPSVAAPVVSVDGSPSASATLGTSIAISATVDPGAGSDTYAWSGLPTGCSAPAASTLTCDPTATGTFDVELRVTDANGVAALSPATAFEVLPSSTGAAFNLALTASAESVDVGMTTVLNASASGANGPLTYAWTGLPTGCTAADLSQLSCAPTASGTYVIGVSATNSAGTTIEAHAGLQVYPALTAQSVLLSTSSPSVGSLLVISVSPQGGSGVYTYAWNGLPAGCAAADSAILTCEPTTVSSFTVSVTVTDSLGATFTPSSATGSVVAAAAAPSTTNAVDLANLALAVLVLVLVVVCLLLLLRRPRSGGRNEEEPEWSETRMAPRPTPTAASSAPSQSPPPPSTAGSSTVAPSPGTGSAGGTGNGNGGSPWGSTYSGSSGRSGATRQPPPL